MEKITYILGAGFSAMAGLPVMSNFIQRAKDMYYDDANKGKYASFPLIFDKMDALSKIKNYFDVDLFNIEELLSILKMESTLTDTGEDELVTDFIIKVIKRYSDDLFTDSRQRDSRDYHLKNLFEKWANPEHNGRQNLLAFVFSLFHLAFQEPQRSYDRGANNSDRWDFTVSDCDYAVVSLNYDTLLEDAIATLSHFQFAPSPLESVSLSFEKDSYLENWKTSDCKSRPMLFKLHGDIASGHIIPPTWAKNIEESMMKIWKSAYQVLKTSTQIRFLGYSLPLSDTYFQYFLKAAIKNNPHLKRVDIVCLDTTGKVEERYKSLFVFRDLRFKNTDLGEYCESLWKYKNSPFPFRMEYNQLEAVHESEMTKS